MGISTADASKFQITLSLMSARIGRAQAKAARGNGTFAIHDLVRRSHCLKLARERVQRSYRARVAHVGHDNGDHEQAILMDRIMVLSEDIRLMEDVIEELRLRKTAHEAAMKARRAA